MNDYDNEELLKFLQANPASPAPSPGWAIPAATMAALQPRQEQQTPLPPPASPTGGSSSSSSMSLKVRQSPRLTGGRIQEKPEVIKQLAARKIAEMALPSLYQEELPKFDDSEMRQGRNERDTKLGEATRLGGLETLLGALTRTQANHNASSSLQQGAQNALADAGDKRRAVMEYLAQKRGILTGNSDRAVKYAEMKRDQEQAGYDSSYDAEKTNLGRSDAERKDLRDSREKQAALDNAMAIARGHNATQLQLAGAQAASEERKHKQTSDLLQAPGYNRLPGAPAIRPEEAGDFRKALAVRNDMQASLARLRALHEKYGTEMLNGDAATKMKSEVGKLTIQVKDLAKLGALSGEDFKLVEKLVPDPTSFWANTKAALGRDTTGAALDELQTQMNSGIEAQADALSYRPKNVPPALTPAAGSPPVPGAQFKGGAWWKKNAAGQWEEL